MLFKLENEYNAMPFKKRVEGVKNIIQLEKCSFKRHLMSKD